jgi:hypothetical protein
MVRLRASLAALCLLVVAGIAPAGAPDRSGPPRPSSAPSGALTAPEREAIVAWATAQPKVKAAVAGHRTRLLRAWSDVAKGSSGSYRRAVMVLRDYDAGTAQEISVNLETGAIETRELVGIQPSREEIEEGMTIVRSDPALATLVANPNLTLIGGFHNRSLRSDDPCSREICLDFAFMKPNYGGPARYVIVNLTRRIVAHHDFRAARPGQPPERMTETAVP